MLPPSTTNDVTWPLIVEARGLDVDCFAADGLSYRVIGDFDRARDARDHDPELWIRRVEIAADHASAMRRFLENDRGIDLGGALVDRRTLDCRSEASAMAFERITVDPARMGGLPTIRDTRLTVSMVLGQLAAGFAVDDVLAEYPYLEREDVLAALEYAATAVNEREVPVARPA